MNKFKSPSMWLLVLVSVGALSLESRAQTETYPGLFLTTHALSIGTEFTWNARSPYAELQPGQTPIVLTVRAGAPFLVAFDMDPAPSATEVVTSAVLTIDGQAATFPAILPQSGGTISSPTQTLATGDHPATVAACNAFGCGPTLAFMLRAGNPPTVPTNLRAALQQVAEALGGLAVSVRALADAQE